MTDSNVYLHRDAVRRGYQAALQRFERAHRHGDGREPQPTYILIPDINHNNLEKVRAWLRDQGAENLVREGKVDIGQLHADLQEGQALLDELNETVAQVHRVAYASNAEGNATMAEGNAQMAEDGSDDASSSEGHAAEHADRLAAADAATAAAAAASDVFAAKAAAASASAAWMHSNARNIGAFTGAATEVEAIHIDGDNAPQRALRVTHAYAFPDAAVSYSLHSSMHKNDPEGEENDWCELGFATPAATTNPTLEVVLPITGAVPRRLQWRVHKPGQEASFCAVAKRLKHLNRAWADMERPPSRASYGTSDAGSQAGGDAGPVHLFQPWAPALDPDHDYEQVRTWADVQACDVNLTLSWIYCPIIRAIAGCTCQPSPTAPHDDRLLAMLSQTAVPSNPEAEGCFGTFLEQMIRGYQQLFATGLEHEMSWVIELNGLRQRHDQQIGPHFRPGFPYIPSAEALRHVDAMLYAEPADICAPWARTCTQEGILSQAAGYDGWFNQLKQRIHGFRQSARHRLGLEAQAPPPFPPPPSAEQASSAPQLPSSSVVMAPSTDMAPPAETARRPSVRHRVQATDPLLPSGVAAVTTLAPTSPLVEELQDSDTSHEEACRVPSFAALEPEVPAPPTVALTVAPAPAPAPTATPAATPQREQRSRKQTNYFVPSASPPTAATPSAAPPRRLVPLPALLTLRGEATAPPLAGRGGSNDSYVAEPRNSPFARAIGPNPLCGLLYKAETFRENAQGQLAGAQQALRVRLSQGILVRSRPRAQGGLVRPRDEPTFLLDGRPRFEGDGMVRNVRRRLATSHAEEWPDADELDARPDQSSEDNRQISAFLRVATEALQRVPVTGSSLVEEAVDADTFARESLRDAQVANLQRMLDPAAEGSHEVLTCVNMFPTDADMHNLESGIRRVGERYRRHGMDGSQRIAIVGNAAETTLKWCMSALGRTHNGTIVAGRQGATGCVVNLREFIASL